MKEHHTQSQQARIDPQKVAAMHASLGLEGEAPSSGDPLPHFWHWSLFWDVVGPGDLGRDGHPKLGGFIPDLGLPRRMWAGGALEFLRPLIVGDEVLCISKVVDVVQKDGRTGPLAFVRVEHEISDGTGVCIKERQDLVYREEPDPDAPVIASKQAPKDEDVRESHSVTTTDLFRYSALTFNGHRIHYDLDYARDIEGYPGLVIHGPLLAQWLIALAERELGELAEFSFRAVAPLFHFETVEVCAKRGTDGLDLWVRGPDGRLAMTAEAR